MKNVTIISCLLFVLVTLSKEICASEEIKSLPTSIIHYYKDVNFIHLFSTAQERSMLASLKNSITSKELNNNPRLKHIMAAMNRVAEMEFQIYPDMSNPVNPWQSNTINDAIIRITTFERKEDTFHIKLDCISISSDEKVKLIREYNDDSYKEFNLSEIERKIMRREIHSWQKTDKEWKKLSTVFSLINDQL